MNFWQEAIKVATELRTPYELGRAHFEIGRHLPQGEPARQAHLQKALELFQQLSCGLELEWTRRELGEVSPVAT